MSVMSVHCKLKLDIRQFRLDSFVSNCLVSSRSCVIMMYIFVLRITNTDLHINKMLLIYTALGLAQRKRRMQSRSLSTPALINDITTSAR